MRLGPRLQPAGHAKRGHREPQERRSSRATARTNNFIEINGATDMSKKLEGKVAVVTGASKGIGAGIAKALAEEGATVVVNYSSSRQDAERVVAQISARAGKAIAVKICATTRSASRLLEE